MRLSPPALDHARRGEDGHGPGPRSAPGLSCGLALRPSITHAAVRTVMDLARGLRLACHAASTSGPRSRTPRCGRSWTGPAVCAWPVISLRRGGPARGLGEDGAQHVRDAVELGVTRDQRRCELDDGIAAVVAA